MTKLAKTCSHKLDVIEDLQVPACKIRRVSKRFHTLKLSDKETTRYWNLNYEISFGDVSAISWNFSPPRSKFSVE